MHAYFEGHCRSFAGTIRTAANLLTLTILLSAAYTWTSMPASAADMMQNGITAALRILVSEMRAG